MKYLIAAVMAPAAALLFAGPGLGAANEPNKNMELLVYESHVAAVMGIKQTCDALHKPGNPTCDSNDADYAKLEAECRQLGGVVIGSPARTVITCLGAATRKSTSVTAAGTVEVWDYRARSAAIILTNGQVTEIRTTN
jgi:hypothetical protein